MVVRSFLKRSIIFRRSITVYYEHCFIVYLNTELEVGTL